MKKRGIALQPFIYIFTIIVIAFIFLFGYKVIIGVKETGEQATYLTFKNDFTKAVNNVYYYNVGSKLTYSSSTRNKPLLLPIEVKEVCFIQDNVVLKPFNEIYKEFSVDNLILPPLQQELCIEAVNNRISFNLTNKVESGDTFVEISKNE